MKKEINNLVTKGVILLMLTLLVGTSCNKEGKNENRKLIPQKELVSLLTDLYLTDGLLAFPTVRAQFSKRDSIANYVDVVEKYGFTKERVDYTMNYYFVNDPKKLEKIYDQVLAKLSDMQSKLEMISSSEARATDNLWNLNTVFSLPEEGVQNVGRFNIPISDTGRYTLSFDAILYNDDKSLDPHTTIYFWRANETEEGLMDYWPEIPLVRDGTRHNYILTGKLADTTMTHIRGLLFNHNPQPGRWEKHARFSNISLKKAGAL
ncbi:MAG: DUF4296 domain-containing protein [Bacteroidales bacterium]